MVSMAALPSLGRPPVAEALRAARHQRGWSQLELSHRLGVSQRHVSFVEVGRSQASRALLGAWLDVLDVPLATRNLVLTQAGYAPAYGEAPLGTPEVALVTDALHRLLQAHDPFPAVVLDADWDVVDSNRGFEWLVRTITGADPGSEPLNLIDLVAGSSGFLGRMVNLDEAAAAFLPQLRHEAATNPGLNDRLGEVVAALAAAGVDPTRWAQQPQAVPVVPLRLASEHGVLAFFTMFTTLGAPQNITVASLRVEHLFPLDEHTQQVLAQQVN